MKIGIHLVQDGLDYARIREIALEAERAGLDSFMILDHMHASPRPEMLQMLECWTVLSALATETSSIRLGALVLNINNRNPAVLAKMATTLDQISCGRLDLGVGAGGTIRAQQQKSLGYNSEFEAYGVSFPNSQSRRIEKLDEGLEIIRRMWTKEKATFSGKFYSIEDAFCLPKPVQKPHPPIWIGSLGLSKMMKVIAKHADGWNIMRASTIEDYRRGIKRLEKACKKIGRNPEEIKTSIAFRGPPDETNEKLKRFSDEGLDLAILRLPRGEETRYLQKTKWNHNKSRATQT
jgi:alkanesulfonate monooxygenase SsuD/methylene tetrahydromethanopterin reductase-like flavin-dependent oxidoreductase (luciferase family)